MTLDKVHRRIDFISGKEISGAFTPEEKDIALDIAQMKVVSEFAPLYAVNQMVKEALAPFIYKLTDATAADGTYTVSPSLNFMKLTSLNVVVSDLTVPAGVPTNRKWPVTIVNEDEESEAFMSQLNQVSNTKPLVVVEGLGKYQFYPNDIAHAFNMRFLRRPAEPVYGYTQSGRGVTYNSGTSTQLEWNDLFINLVINRALGVLGIQLSDEKLQQYGLTYPTL
jgi:hypothetical protein